MTTRDEHIESAKKRALEYLDRGEVRQGFISMLSNLNKHPETKHRDGTIGVRMMLTRGWIDNPREVRRWIKGFNLP